MDFEQRDWPEMREVRWAYQYAVKSYENSSNSNNIRADLDTVTSYTEGVSPDGYKDALEAIKLLENGYSGIVPERLVCAVLLFYTLKETVDNKDVSSEIDELNNNVPWQTYYLLK